AEFQTRTGTRPVLEWAGELPLAKLRLEARVEQTIEELAAVLQPTEFTSDILNSLRAAWTPGRGFACAFATWVETLLGPYGLVVFESADPAAKPLVADVFARELSSPGRTAAMAAEAGEALARRRGGVDGGRGGGDGPAGKRAAGLVAAGQRVVVQPRSRAPIDPAPGG